MNAMTKYLAGVLTVIAMAVSLIAYRLVVPALPAASAYDVRDGAGVVESMRPGQTSPRLVRYVQEVPADEFGSYRTSGTRAIAVSEYADEPMRVERVRTVRTVDVEPEPRRVVTRTVERAPRRDWKKAALVIGGSTAVGSGVGGIFGGKKGALIGAAIGGGASTIYQMGR